ncbi:PREDICTED: jouberin-like [Eufriesea mexicana]|uniref:jouberin-like n=1 Tax=Eufriesea mexicana TaxID=516756 RepID=UPI00083C3353|nr:PREDICTED: jouberin-like [Eufriesea mexicana]
MKVEMQSVLKKKQGKQSRNEINLQSLANRNNYETNLRDRDSDNDSDSDSDSDSEHVFYANDINITEDIGKSSSICNKDKLKLITNTDSINFSESASKSMDVVVDIHQEYKKEKSHNRNTGKDEASNKNLANLFLKESENFGSVSKTNTIHKKNIEKSKINLVKQQNLSKDDDIKVVDSLDLIEEFVESSIEKDEQKIQTVRNIKSTKKNSNQSFVEENLHGRKQWALSKDEKEELKKPTRKRWSKDATVIRLPEARGIFWTDVSSENKSLFVQNLEQSLSATRSSSKQKSLFSFDNAVFVPENEEILRIETDHNRDDTKIEIKEIVHRVNQMELSTFNNRSSSDSLNEEGKSFRETAITIEDLNELTNLGSQSFENRRKNTISDIKYTDKFNRDDIPSKGRSRAFINKRKNSLDKDKKNILDNSNTSQSLEEINTQSNDHSFEEVSTKDDRLLISKGNKKHYQRYSKRDSISVTKDDHDENYLSYFGQDVTSTSEDDDLDERRSRETHDEARLRRSNTKKKKTRYTKHKLQMQEKKDKKMTLRKSISNSSTYTPNVNAEKDSKRKKKKKKEDDIKYISIVIHRTDMLEIDYVTKHPMVKVHIVKAESGKYLKNEYGLCTYLQPIITGKFDFKEKKSIIPVWEEELIFEHDFNTLLKIDNEQVVILFEIVDLLSFAEASFNYDKFGHEGCWYKVAWAFLKPVGRNNVLHIDKKVRLQLYKPRKNLQKFQRLHTCDVYTWWKSNIREKYPSSLFVTVTSIDPPKLEPVLYGQLSLHNLSDTRNESQKMPNHASDSINLPKWNRLGAQSCKIPNEILFQTEIAENGCFCIVFSNNGKYLACSFSEENDYPIVIYEVQGKKIYVRFSGHKTFVYSLNWSSNDNYLLSVSSDQTARIWNVQNQIVKHVEMMPHPSYVYCGKFDPKNSLIVATGCYDRITRIWLRNKEMKNCDLCQELEGHEGFVNSMYFQKNSNLLTADSVGIIIIWILKKNKKVSSRKEWYISRKIKVREIDGIIINTIILHPLESRLLVHSRNNGLKMLDLATGVVLQKYNELNNQRIQSTACISPCGNLIFCGGEDSTLNVWNLETGNLLAKYTFDRHYRAVTCVDYHPYDQVLAFSTFGSPAPVRILRFNKDITGEDIGLKMVKEVKNTVMNDDISMRFLNTSIMSKEKLRLYNKKGITEETSKEKNLQSNRNYDSSLFKFSNNVILEKDKYTDTKMKLQRLNEAGQTLKNRSANRLYNIIEKIDRILSNTTKSSGDIESGRNFTILRKSNESEVLTSLYDNIEKEEETLKKQKSTNLSTEDQSSFYFESSVMDRDSQRIVKCHTPQSKRINDWDKKGTKIQKRPRSAKETKSSNIPKSDISKSFSDSATNYQKDKVYDRLTKISSPANIGSDFIVEMEENDKTLIYYKSNSCKKSDSDSTDSARTYVIEKNVIEDNDKNVIIEFESKDLVLNALENDSNMKSFESDNSLPSNATFTINRLSPK